jgi:hypothetical protein
VEWFVLELQSDHLPVLVHGGATNQRVSVSFIVVAEQAAEATKRRARKDAGKRVGFSAIVRVARLGGRERKWLLLKSASLPRAVGIRTAARSKR